MTTLDGSTIAALIAIGALLFLTGWRMGSWIAKANNKIAILDKTIADNAGELARLEQEYAKRISPLRDYRRPF